MLRIERGPEGVYLMMGTTVIASTMDTFKARSFERLAETVNGMADALVEIDSDITGPDAADKMVLIARRTPITVASER